MNCPSCSTEMEHVDLEGKLGLRVEVDLCFACHALWLDKRESLQLAPRGTLDLFEILHEHRDDARHALDGSAPCPRCAVPLRLVKDIGKGGRFAYFRCPAGHGRLTPFSEFLKEKQFVRALSPMEKKRVSADIKQVQCSSCGAPVDVTAGFECGHCGSAITVLDADAVAKTLRELQSADAAAKAVDPEDAAKRARALAAMEAARTDPDRYVLRRPARPASGLSGTDLLTASISFLFREL